MLVVLADLFAVVGVAGEILPAYARGEAHASGLCCMA